ncbi:hypothetical protein EJ07DRAFT_179441 [Lizonia empirigonia]|nr:hypothetical protein EJ07DRAFT_179441 [Lizonia empirigonia]
MYSNGTWQPVGPASAEIPSETPPVALSDTFSDMVTDESSNMPSDAPSNMSSETLSDTPSEAPSGTPSDTIPTTFKMTNLAVYAKYSVGLWQPTHPIIYLIMKSTSSTSDPTLPHDPAEPLAHCPTLEAAHQTLEGIA